MVKKRFDQTLYDLSDTKAKEVISALLIEDGHTITSTQEKYRCDIITEKDGEIHNAEVEIKFSWKYDWPRDWLEIRIPYRKKKLLGNSNLTFYVLRADCKQVWKIPATTLSTLATVKEVSNRYVPKGEEFFHIPVEHATLLDI